jgi:hypothetical protein
LARTHVHASVDDGNGRPKIAPLATPVPTPYNHLEGALAVSLGLPLLIVAEKGMARDGIFNSGVKAVEVPSDASAAWVRSHAFRSFLPTWSKRVRDRRDVFLGYCSKGGKVASALRASVERAGFTVLDWSEHFAKAGAFILDEIERAATRCRCAVFLFTKDDELGKAATRKASAKALPRDNVLVEAGYFTRARGKARVAIVREAGTKMPADFGGVIYLGFDDRKDLTDVKAGLVEFIKTALSTDGARRT